MDENALIVLCRELLEGKGKVTVALPYLIDLTLEFGREVPEHIVRALDATGRDWRYYNTMIYYAIQWNHFMRSHNLYPKYNSRPRIIL